MGKGTSRIQPIKHDIGGLKMNEETLQIVEIIEFRSFREKLDITKEYDHIAKMMIIDDKYVLVERMEVAI